MNAWTAPFVWFVRQFFVCYFHTPPCHLLFLSFLSFSSSSFLLSFICIFFSHHLFLLGHLSPLPLVSCLVLRFLLSLLFVLLLFFSSSPSPFHFSSHSTITTTTSSSLHLLRVTFFYFVDFLLLIFSLHFSSYSFLEMRMKLSRYHSGCPTLLILQTNCQTRKR